MADKTRSLITRLLDLAKGLPSLLFVGWVLSKLGHGKTEQGEASAMPVDDEQATDEEQATATDAADEEPESEPPPSPERRKFLTTMIAGLGGLGAAVVATPVVAFVLSPLLKEDPDVWRPVGPPSDFKVGDTTKVSLDDPSSLAWSGVASQTGAWLRKEGDNSYVAFSINCTHLGCPVRWEANARLFMCPCHGGVYYEDGRVAGGPPPKPLTRLDVRVEAGQVEVRTKGLTLTGGIIPHEAGQ